MCAVQREQGNRGVIRHLPRHAGMKQALYKAALMGDHYQKVDVFLFNILLDGLLEITFGKMLYVHMGI